MFGKIKFGEFVQLAISLVLRDRLSDILLVQGHQYDKYDMSLSYHFSLPSLICKYLPICYKQNSILHGASSIIHEVRHEVLSELLLSHL